MIEPKINSAAFCFLGIFPLEKIYIDQKIYKKEFEPLTVYRDNKNYFDQKYYNNWICSIFPPFSKYKQNPGPLKLKKDSSIFKEEFQINQPEEEIKVDFVIKDINVFFFQANLGIFIIKIDLPKTVLIWKDIIFFGSNFRKSTINSNFSAIPLSVELVEQYITIHFNSNNKEWRTYNPQLKTAVFLDIDQKPDPDLFDKLLYDVGTFTGLEDSLYQPSNKYLEQLIRENELNLFNNWRALFLYDSLVRFSINLNAVDKYKLWENEYILIYIHVLYARYFLHHTNKALTSLFENSKLIERERDKFFKFINESDHVKISFKFLPNLIYSKLKMNLGINEEIKVIEAKLTRLNTLKQEKYEKRTNRTLFALMLLTLISVAHDGGQMLKTWEWSQALKVSISIIGVFTGILLLLFYDKFKD